jgi:hypothetical protein
MCPFTAGVSTVPVGQGWRKIILKIDAKILGKLFFQIIFSNYFFVW